MTAARKGHVEANRCRLTSQNQVYRPVVSAFVPASQTHSVDNDSHSDNNLVIGIHRGCPGCEIFGDSWYEESAEFEGALYSFVLGGE